MGRSCERLSKQLIDSREGAGFSVHLKGCIDCQMAALRQIRERYVSNDAMAIDLGRRTGFDKIHRATIIRWQDRLEEGRFLPPRGLRALEALGWSRALTPLRVALHPAIQALPALLVHPYSLAESRSNANRSDFEKLGGKIEFTLTKDGSESITLVNEGNADVTIASTEFSSNAASINCRPLGKLGTAPLQGFATREISNASDLAKVRIFVPAGSALVRHVSRCLDLWPGATRPEAFKPADIPKQLEKCGDFALIGWQGWLTETMSEMGYFYEERSYPPRSQLKRIAPGTLPGMPVAIYINMKTVPVDSLRIYLDCMRKVIKDLESNPHPALAEVARKFFPEKDAKELRTQARGLRFDSTLETILDLWNRKSEEVSK